MLFFMKQVMLYNGFIYYTKYKFHWAILLGITHFYHTMNYSIRHI